MDLLAIFGFLVLIYHLFYMMFLWFLNCNLQLALMKKYGKSIETLRGKVVWIVGASSGIGEVSGLQTGFSGLQINYRINQKIYKLRTVVKIAYFESLYMEKMNSNIPTTIICPGSVETDILSQVLIDNSGEVNNKPSSNEKNKISLACCSKLIAVALANKLHEVWISPPCRLQVAYTKVYYPNIYKFLMKILGVNFIEKIHDNTEVLETTS